MVSRNPIWSKDRRGRLSMSAIAIAAAFTLTQSAGSQQQPVGPLRTTAERRQFDSLALQRYKDVIKKRSQWLSSRGLLSNYQSIRALLTPERVAEMFPGREQHSQELIDAYLDYVAQNIATTYSIERIRQLQARGIDVLKSYGNQSHDPAPMIQRIANQTELVVVGEVVGTDTIADREDGNLSTVTIKIVDILQGVPATQTIYIRERSGKTREGYMRVAPGELVYRDTGGSLRVPKNGARYVFFLSSGAYALQAITAGKVPLDNEALYYTYRCMPLPIVKDYIEPPTDQSLSAKDIPRTIAALRAAIRNGN